VFFALSNKYPPLRFAKDVYRRLLIWHVSSSSYDMYPPPHMTRLCASPKMFTGAKCRLSRTTCARHVHVSIHGISGRLSYESKAVLSYLTKVRRYCKFFYFTVTSDKIEKKSSLSPWLPHPRNQITTICNLWQKNPKR